MKFKKLIIGLVLIFGLLLSGCSNIDSQTNNTGSNVDTNQKNIQETNIEDTNNTNNVDETITTGIISENETVEIGELI